MPRRGQPPERMREIRPLAIAARQQRVADKIAAGKAECGRCHEVLPFSAYAPERKRALGIQGYCRRCHADDVNERYHARKAAEAAELAAHLAALAAHPEIRVAAVAVRWSIGCSQEDALLVAELVEPRPAIIGRPRGDRVEAVANMHRLDLLELARRAGVQPGERPTPLPQPPSPMRYPV